MSCLIFTVVSFSHPTCQINALKSNANVNISNNSPLHSQVHLKGRRETQLENVYGKNENVIFHKRPF